MSKMSLYRASSGPAKSDIKLDGAGNTQRICFEKCNTNTRSHKYTHYSIYTPPYPHTRNHLLLVSFLYRMYISGIPLCLLKQTSSHCCPKGRVDVEGLEWSLALEGRVEVEQEEEEHEEVEDEQKMVSWLAVAAGTEAAVMLVAGGSGSPAAVISEGEALGGGTPDTGGWDPDRSWTCCGCRGDGLYCRGWWCRGGCRCAFCWGRGAMGNCVGGGCVCPLMVL